MVRSVVVFPAPLAPTSVTISLWLDVERDVPDRLDVPVEDVDALNLQRLHARASVSSPR